MHILMCNDDGILADGLRRLASYLSQYYRITVVAPANEQSAKSHALTTEIPLKLDAYNGEDENPRLYALTGTPSDCMKFGLSYLKWLAKVYKLIAILLMLALTQEGRITIGWQAS